MKAAWSLLETTPNTSSDPSSFTLQISSAPPNATTVPGVNASFDANLSATSEYCAAVAVPVKLATSVPTDTVIPPDLSAAVAVVKPIANVSVDSSQMIAALLPVEPLSMISPASFDDADIPVLSSIKLSAIVVFDELTVVVVPLTVN